jgi:uncharacterized Zn finger protein (UPF0148 family)
MAELMKDKRHSDRLAMDRYLKLRAAADKCETCGQRLVRDPESGQYYCPDCDFSEE